MIALATRNLQKSYNGNLVLKGLNLNINQGEVYGFIGMNGAGKTTTINLIMSLISKNSGEIKVLEQEVLFEDQLYKQNIGFVPDVPRFPKHMNSYEYLRYTQEMFSQPYEEDRIEEMLKFVSLQGNRKKISTYSRGMKQRLAIAQALIHDPEILIMDEPMSALDPIGRNDVLNIIKKLKGKKTIFYSTHILDDVEKACDRVGILHNGELVLEDSISNLQNKFLSNKFRVLTKDNYDGLNKELYTDLRQLDNGFLITLKDEFRSKDLLKELVRLDVNVMEIKQATKSIEDIFIEETKWKHY